MTGPFYLMSSSKSRSPASGLMSTKMIVASSSKGFFSLLPNLFLLFSKDRPQFLILSFSVFFLGLEFRFSTF